MVVRKSFVWILFWVLIFAFFLITAGSKFYKLHSLKNKIGKYGQKIHMLEERAKYLEEQKNSSDDPVWLELALMEELGVIPQGAIKINYLEDP